MPLSNTPLQPVPAVSTCGRIRASAPPCQAPASLHTRERRPRTRYHRAAVILILAALLLAHTAQAFSELTGTHLRGCAVVEVPYVIADENRREKFSGVAIDYLDRLRDNLQFTFDMTLWNGTWEALLVHFSVCNQSRLPSNSCVCDLGVGPFTITTDYFDLVSFVWAFGNENYHMVIRKDLLRVEDSNHAWFVFKTFSGDVWLFILLGVVMHALGTVYYGPFRASGTLNAQHQGEDARTATALFWQLKRFPAAVLYAYSHLIGHPFAAVEQQTPSFHKTAWLLLGLTSGLFLVTVYQASLTVLLFESTKRSPFTTITDLRECTLSPRRIAMVGSSASQEYWNFAVNTSANRRLCGWKRAGVPVRDLEEGFRFLEEKKVDYFFDLEASVLFRAHLNCDLFQPVGEPFFSTSVAFVMPKSVNKTVLTILSRETRALRERDAFDAASVVAARHSCEDTIDATLTSGKLSAFFVMYGIVWMLLMIWRALFLWRRNLKQAIAPDHTAPTALSMMTANGHFGQEGLDSGTAAPDDRSSFDNSGFA